MRSEIVELTAELVAIDSVNPSLVPGGAGEREIAAFVGRWARAAGLEVERREATPGRPSVIVRARGTGGGRTLLLCGHLDTVNVEGMSDPHVPRVAGDRLFGRGAYDMKAGLAAALLACREAARLGLAGDVVVAAVADEEHASLGVQEALVGLRADAAIVPEPTGLELTVAHKGFVWTRIEVHGRAAHGSRPDVGVDAIVHAGALLTAIGELDGVLHQRTHPRLGRGSIHASTISGGVELSSYPARCVIELERRTLPGETAASVAAELETVLDRWRRADPARVGNQETVLVREPFAVAADAEIVTIVQAAAREAAGGRAVVAAGAGLGAGDAPAAVADASAAPLVLGGGAYWADSAFIAAAGIPTVLFGPGGAGAHEAQEWVSLADTELVTRVLIGAARRLCG
jgi:acetylornithine deacetylase